MLKMWETVQNVGNSPWFSTVLRYMIRILAELVKKAIFRSNCVWLCVCPESKIVANLGCRSKDSGSLRVTESSLIREREVTRSVPAAVVLHLSRGLEELDKAAAMCICVRHKHLLCVKN